MVYQHWTHVHLQRGRLQLVDGKRATIQHQSSFQRALRQPFHFTLGNGGAERIGGQFIAQVTPNKRQ
jgi:hypothetical protein